MRTVVVGILTLLVSIGCADVVNGTLTEEQIFEKPPYVEAAKAISQNNIASLEKVLKQGFDINFESKEIKTSWGKDTMTLLVWAMFKDSAKGAETLLKAGADPNKTTQLGLSPMMMAASSKSDKLFELMMSYKADPDKILWIGVPTTALTMVLQERRALGEKRFDRAERLLKYGADIDLNIDRGETALIKFSIVGDWHAVFWLLEREADYEVRDSVRATMMCYLRNSYRADTLAPSEAYTYRDRVRDWLLAHGVARSRVDPALHPDSKCDD
jgi:hypothetical protein